MDIILSILKHVINVFKLCPVKKNRVILTAYNGRQYSCNPKYIAEALLVTKKYEVVYALCSTSRDSLPKDIKRVKYRSLKHFYYLMTSGFVIFNSSGISNLLSYRKEQTIINTWHGGYSFKVIGNDIFKDQKSIKARREGGKILTYFLSGSQLATEQYNIAMSIPIEKFLTIGLPRNDILFEDHTQIRKKIYDKFKIDESSKIVLYAPTYRDGPVMSMLDYGLEKIDDEAVVKALEDRFGGKFVFMYKAHHDMVPTNIGVNCVNASLYSDIQELMCASEVIISDYSSCSADFALQRKIGFLFTPDLKEYETVHPYSMAPEKWPYQTANSNEILINNIISYDEKEGIEKIESFLKEIGNKENGHTTECLLQIMNDKLHSLE